MAGESFGSYGYSSKNSHVFGGGNKLRIRQQIIEIQLNCGKFDLFIRFNNSRNANGSRQTHFSSHDGKTSLQLLDCMKADAGSRQSS